MIFSWETCSHTWGCAHLFLSVPLSVNPITFKSLNKSQFFLILTYVEILFFFWHSQEFQLLLKRSPRKEPFRLCLQLPSRVTDMSVETSCSMSFTHPSLLTLALTLKYECLPYTIKPSPSFFLIFVSEFFPWSWQESGNTLQGGSITFRILKLHWIEACHPAGGQETEGYCPPGGKHPCLGWNSQMAPRVYHGLLTLVGGALTLAVWKWGVCAQERKPILEGMQKGFSDPSSPHLRTSLDYMLASGSDLWKHLVLGNCSLIYYVSLSLSLGMAAIPQSHGMRERTGCLSPGGECSKANWSKYVSSLLTSQFPLKRGQ